MENEKLLLKRAQVGDSVAVEKALYHARDFLRGFIGCHVSVRADADDVVQDAVMVVADKLDVFDVERSFDSWLSGIAWIFISRYQAGEYTAGKRKGPVGKDEIPYMYRDVILSCFGIDDEDLIDPESDDGNCLPGDGFRWDIYPIRYSPEAEREMMEAERAFRGN